MATQQVTIYNGLLNSNQENLTDTFINGVGFYLIIDNNVNQIEVDIFLQVELSNTVTRQIRLQPFNLSNTQRITLLPSEIAELNLPLKLSILPSDSFNLEVILLQTDCRICSLKLELDSIQLKLDEIKSALKILPENPNNPTPVEQTFFFIN